MKRQGVLKIGFWLKRQAAMGIPRLIEFCAWGEPKECTGIARIQSDRPTQRWDPKTLLRSIRLCRAAANRLLPLCVLPMICACGLTAPASVGQRQVTPGHAGLEPGVVCVVTKDIDEAEDVEISAQAIGYVRKNRRILDGLGFVMIIMEVPPGYSVRQGIAELRTKFPALVIDANHRYSLNSAAHHDTRIYARRLIGWDPVTPRCGAEIRLGLVDTRVDLTHPVLKRQNIKNRSFLPQEATAAPADHGTSIAALLVGKPMNETAGLLPESSLFVAEIFREREARRFETTTWLIVRAFDWLVQKNVHVINLSFGGSQNSLLAFAVRRTLDNNISLVAAAGHHSPLGGPSYPAAQEGVVAVTALDADRRPYRRAASGPYISLSAPGVDIWVPDADGMGRYVSGTSFAAPFVTAVIASFKRVHPHWTPEQIRQAIERSALDLGNPGWDPIFGWGLVQAPIACQR